MMIEYDRIIIKLRNIVKDKLYCEDSELKSKCMKYDIINLMLEEDNKFMNELFKELEYDENE